MVVFGAGKYLHEILDKETSLTCEIERLLDTNETYIGKCLRAGLPVVERLGVLMTLQPGTKIYVTETSRLNEVRNIVASLRSDLQCVAFEDIVREKQEVSRRKSLVRQNSRKRRRVFWGVKNTEVNRYRPFERDDIFVEEDKSLHGDWRLGLPICSPEVLRGRQGQDFIIVLPFDYSRIKQKLEREYGLHEYEDFVSENEFWEQAEQTVGIRPSVDVKALLSKGESPKVSVLMPSLNVAPYIRQAVESVQKQTLRDLEIICIDAGSTDGTLEVLRELAADDDRIRILNSPVRSYGYQMNMGLAAAKGEYIGIVETDDWVQPEMYMEEYLAAIAQDAEVVKADYWIFKGEAGQEEFKYQKLIDLSEAAHYYGKLLSLRRDKISLYFGNVTWTGLYKRTFLEKHNIRWHESPGAAFQDNGFWFLVMAQAERIIILPRAYYMLSSDSGKSMVHDSQNIHTMFREYAYIKSSLEQNRVEDLWREFYIAQYTYCLWYLDTIAEELRQEYTRYLVEEFHADITVHNITVEMLEEGNFCKMQKLAAEQEEHECARICPATEPKSATEKTSISSINKRQEGQSLVSVLVPVCNVEKYLGKCIESLLRQTLTNIEIICIDDGSTDNSPEILDWYADQADNLTVIHKPNSGYGASMNLGLAKARGKYIGIVESDDFAEKDMFERLYLEAEHCQADVAWANMYFHVGGKDKYFENLARTPYGQIFTWRECPAIFYTMPAIWSGLYRTDFLREHGIDFLETPGASYQDTGFRFKAMISAERMCSLREALLHYRYDNPNASVKSSGKIFCVSDEYEAIWDYVRNHGKGCVGVGPYVAYQQFESYRWNLARLDYPAQQQFFPRIVHDFRRLEREGMLQRNVWEAEGTWSRVTHLVRTGTPLLEKDKKRLRI